MTWDPLQRLRAEALYHRQRHDLYRAKTYGSAPTSESRLRELKRASDSAELRLAEALAVRAASAPERE